VDDPTVAASSSPPPQVLLGPMDAMLADMIRVALAGADLDVLPPRASAADLRPTHERAAPPVAFVSGSGRLADFERELLRRRPEAMILRVDTSSGALLAELLYPRRQDLGELSGRRIREAIAAAPSWESRFGGEGP
jgi:hypothetical protein